MKKIIQPKYKRTFVLLAVLAFTSFNVYADHHEAPPPPEVLESFLCSYNSGKDRGDLMAARDFYVKQAAKAGFATPDAYLWSLNKGDLPFQVVWLNVHQDLNAYGAADDAFAASSDMIAAGERFNSVLTCNSGIGMISPVFQREGSDGGNGSSVVSASACGFRGNVGPGDIQDLTSHIAEVVGGMGDSAPNFMITVSPLTGGPATPDLLLFSVNQNMSAWTGFVSKLRSSEAGASLGRHFNAVLDCNLTLWNSTQVVGGDG